MMKKISDKSLAQMPIYYDLTKVLTNMCHNKSELSGDRPGWPFVVEAHHIGGRTGELFTNPFNLIMLTPDEHRIQTLHLEGEVSKDKLREIVRPIRLAQGFKKEG